MGMDHLSIHHLLFLQQTGEEFDFHDIFADYFEDFNADQMSNALAAQQHVQQVVAQQQQQQQQQQQLNLPTGQGIQTAWHLGNLPSMNTGANGTAAGGSEEPSAKRTRVEENLLLPGGGVGNGATMQQQQQSQQTYSVPSGVGALSNRRSMAHARRWLHDCRYGLRYRWCTLELLRRLDLR